MDRAKLDKQIKRNYAAFSAMEFDTAQKGQFALLRDGALVEILASRLDAHKLAGRLYPDRLYSIQEIHPTFTDLGWMSYAVR